MVKFEGMRWKELNEEAKTELIIRINEYFTEI